ncbi:glycoside hydrolase family 13 protein [Vararia minispora EC-137]|uniref:Glycoside hydrolase family 13 protein n=1 Tax=Vararia minispora EC-137 TaxID=1314806 RepID=A0ACB8QDC7_9AGAM|nr:glycoside hydrolase family 13 protein [Vararia minispora EC-137]
MSLGPSENTENPTMFQFFTWDSQRSDMSWWQHLAAESPRLAEHGVTQVWIPPANKALNKWDLGEFCQKGTVSTRWGSKDELVEAIRVARENGIDVLLDAVLNHKLGGDRTETFKVVPVDENDRMKEVGPVREIEGWTAFDFPERKGRYSSFRWTQEHFTGLDWDHRASTKGIFRIVGGNHKGWSPSADNELGNYDYLLGIDIDHRHLSVRQDLFHWAKWSLDITGSAGFRMDAIKHYDYKFLLDWVNSRFPFVYRLSFVVAEYWSVNIKRMLKYVYMLKREVAFFDKHLHDNFHNACKQGSQYDLRNILKGSLVDIHPDDAVTFVDNHECQIGQSLESWVDNRFKLQAYAIILLRGRGHPCVFYGDVFTNQECHDPDVSRGVVQLMKARKTNAYGPLTDFFEHENCIGFWRCGDSSHPGCFVVLSNSPTDA